MSDFVEKTRCTYTAGGTCYNSLRCKCKCEHLKKTIVVIAAAANCETTVLKCDDCDKVLTKPKIECL